MLLDIYPKNGPSQQLDISDAQLIEIVRQYVDDREKQILIPFEILLA